MTTEGILQRLVDLTRAAPAPAKWSFLPAVKSVRQLPFADPKVMDSLSEDFTSEQLEEARVLVRRPNGDLDVNSVLVGEATQGLFLKSAEGAEPFDIVNLNGSLVTGSPPAFDCGHDYFIKRFSGNPKIVFVAFSDNDLAVLRQLSLSCTSAAGLAEMTGRHLRLLFENLPGFRIQESNKGEAISVVSGRFQLVLVGWSVAKLLNEVPEGVNSVVKRLINAEEAFGVDSSPRVSVWQPSDRDFSRIRSAAEIQDLDLARNLIWKSANCTALSARQYQDAIARRNPLDYDFARRELVRKLKRVKELGFQSSEIEKALHELKRSFNERVVGAIVRDAMSAIDPMDRALMLSASGLMKQLHDTSPLVRSTENGIAGRYNPEEDRPLDTEELKETLRVVDRIVKISRELHRNR